MANLVAMNMKKKEHAEVANHGFSIFVDPKRLKLQDGEILDMTEEEKPSVGVPTDATMPTMGSSWLQPTQGQEAAHHTLNTAYGVASSEPLFSTDQAAAIAVATAPLDIEVQLLQQQPQAPPCQQEPFWSGFF